MLVEIQCDLIMFKRYEARSVKAYWTEDSRCAQLCGLAVKVINPDTHCISGNGEPLVYEVVGSPQQVANFEHKMTHGYSF